MDIYMKSRDGLFDAIGTIDNGKICVKRGSVVKKNYSKNLPKAALTCREKAKFDSQMVLQEDVFFDSASTAGAFVTGNITNGLRAWKDENGQALGNKYCGKTKKHKKGI